MTNSNIFSEVISDEYKIMCIYGRILGLSTSSSPPANKVFEYVSSI